MTSDDNRIALPTNATRRQMLAGALGGAATALAGCGNRPGTGETPGEEGPDTPTATPVDSSDLVFKTTEFNDPRKTNYNPYDSLSFPDHTANWLFGQLFRYTVNGENKPAYVPELATDWEKDGDVVTLQLSDKYTWHNGDPVTSRDVKTQFLLDKLTEKESWKVFESVETPDDYTVKINLQTANVNENIVFDYLCGGVQIAVKHSEYKQFLPSDDAGPGEVAQKRGQLKSLEVGNSRASEEWSNPIGWGPFKHVEQTDRFIYLEKYEDYHLADELNFSEIEMEWFSEQNPKFQNLAAGNFSGITGSPPASFAQQIPSKYKKYRHASRTGFGLAFNWDPARKASNPDIFEKRNVRLGIAYATDKEKIVANSGSAQGSNKVHKWDSSFFASKEEHAKFVGEGFVEDKLVQYEKNDEKAAEHLEKAGWSKEDGEWYDAKGNRATFEFTTSTVSPILVNMGETFVNQMQEFGINAQFRSQGLVVYFAQTNPQAKYDMNHRVVGGSRPFPYFALNFHWNGNRAIPEKNNIPDEVEVPMPIGDPEGSLETVNMQDLLEQIQKAEAGSDEIQQLYRKGMWIYNQTMPVICPYEGTTETFINEDAWTSPEKGTKVAGAGLNAWMHRALIKAKKTG